jgi:hypothetical protein
MKNKFSFRILPFPAIIFLLVASSFLSDAVNFVPDIGRANCSVGEPCEGIIYSYSDSMVDT